MVIQVVSWRRCRRWWKLQQVLDQVILLQLVHLKEIMEEQEVEVLHVIMEEVVVQVL
jgi:hypothetical protein